MGQPSPHAHRLSETERETARAAALAAVRLGATYPAAAKRAGVSCSMVYLWARAAGLPRRRHQVLRSASTRRAAVARVEAGESISQVARATGIPWRTVAVWCAAAGVGSAHRNLAATPRLRRRICELRRQGKGVVEVAAIVGMSRSRVSAIARAGGVEGRPPQRRVEEVRRRILAGESAATIAKAVGITPHTVYRHKSAMRAAGLL